jgi:phosphoribosylamine--glycine ligase
VPAFFAKSTEEFQFEKKQMKILVVGAGGREHALCRVLQKNGAPRNEIFCAPGNAGIAADARCFPISATNVAALANLAEQERVDLTIVGGETALAAGIADEFARRRLLIAAPKQIAARLETSKIFAKDFMSRHRIPTARYRAATTPDEARAILESGEFGDEKTSVVIKLDGLAAGKGVIVARSRAEAFAAVETLMRNGARVVIEEALTGREASLLLWTDGRDYRLMPPARDHKRIGENDTGANTGGMGAVTAEDVIDEAELQKIVREIVEPTLAGIQAENLPFRGVLFIGLMLTPEGARVLEYNARFGDPEAQAILVRLRTDLREIFAATARGEIGKSEVEWSHEASACVVLAARGYPEKAETGARISGLDAQGQLDRSNLTDASLRDSLAAVQIFHAGTARGADGAWLTAGGRVLGVTATGGDLNDALKRCYGAIEKIGWEGMQFRRDIGRMKNK